MKRKGDFDAKKYLVKIKKARIEAKTRIGDYAVVDDTNKRTKDDLKLFYFTKIVRIPPVKQYFEVDLLKIQFGRENLTIPDLCVDIIIGDEVITDSFYFANTQKLKTIQADGSIYISNKDIIEEHYESLDFFNVFFLKKEESSLSTVFGGWYDDRITMNEIIHSKTFPYLDLVVCISFYSKKQFEKDLKKLLLIRELLNMDISIYIMLNYLVPILSQNCACGVRRKDDDDDFDLINGNYIISNKWDGQPRGFQDTIDSIMWQVYF